MTKAHGKLCQATDEQGQRWEGSLVKRASEKQDHCWLVTGSQGSMVTLALSVLVPCLARFVSSFQNCKTDKKNLFCLIMKSFLVSKCYAFSSEVHQLTPVERLNLDVFHSEVNSLHRIKEQYKMNTIQYPDCSFSPNPQHCHSPLLCRVSVQFITLPRNREKLCFLPMKKQDS